MMSFDDDDVDDVDDDWTAIIGTPPKQIGLAGGVGGVGAPKRVIHMFRFCNHVKLVRPSSTFDDTRSGSLVLVVVVVVVVFVLLLLLFVIIIDRLVVRSPPFSRHFREEY